MLSDISIRNVVLIESLDLELGQGLTALTGETGAGKSIILDALGMATGARSDRGLVRSGTEKAQCSATFDLPEIHPALQIATEADIDIAEGEPLVLRRTINSDGRSRAYINDSPVSVKLLSEIGTELLEVHGQHDGRGLLDPNQHIHMLDEFGGYKTELDGCRSAFSEKRKAETRLNDLLSKAQRAEDEREFLTHAIEELDRLDPRKGEDAHLTLRRKFLQSTESALTELASATAALGEDEEFENRLSVALAGIERIRDKIGSGDETASTALTNAAEALEKAIVETQEARSAIEGAAQVFDADPDELDDIDKRFFALRAAARKYDVSVDELIEKRSEFASLLNDIETLDDDLKTARRAFDAAQKAFETAADALTAKRKEVATTLETSVMTEMPPLKMERATFNVSIQSTTESALGQDKVRFLVSTNPGTALGPIDRIASGGELARFALAIKVALASSNRKVMVFDEVDQGVGGAVASAVGKRLSELSQSGQVLVVTHSPQVAACASHQFRIEKSSTGDTTTTDVISVSNSDREREIARMLAGETVTDEAVAAARQLMKAS